MQRAYDSLTHSQLNANCEQYFSTENRNKIQTERKKPVRFPFEIRSFLSEFRRLYAFTVFHSWWVLYMCVSAAACLCGFLCGLYSIYTHKLTNYTLLMQFSVVSRYFRHVRHEANICEWRSVANIHASLPLNNQKMQRSNNSCFNPILYILYVYAFLCVKLGYFLCYDQSPIE